MTRLERECLDLLRCTLRIKDAAGQGQPISADAFDLLTRAEDVLMRMVTNLSGLPVVETRPTHEVRQ